MFVVQSRTSNGMAYIIMFKDLLLSLLYSQAHSPSRSLLDSLTLVLNLGIWRTMDGVTPCTNLFTETADIDRSATTTILTTVECPTKKEVRRAGYEVDKDRTEALNGYKEMKGVITLVNRRH